MNATPAANKPNIQVLDDAFFIPQLKRTRRIWLYLPAGYHATAQRYPVMYMHDGQNLFDNDTAFDKGWQVHKTLNRLHAQCIVVGIDNSERRMQEYNFTNHQKWGKGEGKKYIRFIAETLKPYIDAHFKTLPGREDTHLAGSSMGGLVSLYGALHFAEVFGSAGIFSPSLWLTPAAVEQLQPLAKKNKKYPQRLYFYGGAREGCNMLENIGRIADMLAQYGHYRLAVEVDGEGEHNETQWQKKFKDYYRWITTTNAPAAPVEKTQKAAVSRVKKKQ